MEDSKQLPVYSQRLIELREASGLSQRELGIRAGIDETSAGTRVSRYESGVHEPDLESLEALAKVLRAPLAFFYSDDDELAEKVLTVGRKLEMYD